MNISLFLGNIKNTTNQEQISIETFLQRIAGGFWKTETEKIRAIDDHNERQDLKSKILPYVTISGIFGQRNNNSIQEYSGFLAIDIDHAENELEKIRNIIQADPYTYSVFTSVSGQGLCVIIRTTSKDNHLNHFLWARDHYKSIAEVYIDESCKDISRPRYASHDPKCFINYNAKVSGQKKPSKKKPQKPPLLPTTDEQIHRLVTELVNQGIDLCDDYDSWVRMGLSLVSHLGENGREYFHGISSVSSKYDENQCDRKYTNLLKTASGAISIGTFLDACKSNGLSIYTPEETQAIAIAKQAKKGNSDISTAVKMAEQTGINPELTKQIAEQVFENDYDLNSSSIIAEIASHVNLNYKVRYNIFTDQTEYNNHPITERDRNDIYNTCCLSITDKVTKTDVNSVLDSSAIKSYHPVTEWLKTAKNLPNKPEIVDEVLSILPYKVPDAKCFLYHWFLGIPATYHGDTVRLVAVLCGKQETGKTEFFRKSLPPALIPYFRESALSDDAEIPLVMTTSLINVDDEFGGKAKKDAIKFKEITSKNKFDFRPKYGRTIVTRKRTAMLAGTSNDTEIIQDRTGNTRILPIEYNQAYDFEKYNAIDKDQFMIEIFRLYESGQSWKLDQKAKELLQSLTTEHEVVDYELQLVDLFTDTSPLENAITYAEIKMHLEACSRTKIISDHKLGQALAKRFDRKLARINGKVCKCYRSVTLKQLHERSAQVVDNQTDDKPPF